MPINFEDFEEWIRKGNSACVGKQHNQAIRYYTQGIENLHDIFLNRGFCYHLSGEYDKAIADYTQVISINPKSFIAYSNRSWSYNEKREMDKAIEDCNQALKINPKYALAYENLGEAYYLKEEYGKAWENIRKAQGLGAKVSPELLKNVCRALGINKDE